MAKEITHAHRAMEIVKERGMKISEIMKHDLLPVSPLLDGNFTTKTGKSQTHVLLDFMSKIRQYRDLTHFTNLSEIIHAVMTSTKKCLRLRAHSHNIWQL